MVAEVEVSAELSVQEAAYLAGVSERSVRNWMQDGKLPFSLSEQRKRIKRENLLHFLQERQKHFAVPAEVTPTPTPAPTEGSPGVTPERWTEAAEAPQVASEVRIESLAGLIERLHRENVELAGRIGFYQAKLQEYEQRILLLEAPQDAPVTTPGQPVMNTELAIRSWWRRLFGLE